MHIGAADNTTRWPPELGQLIGAMEHCALSTSRSFLEEQTIPFPLPKGEPLLVQQYLRDATRFPVSATVPVSYTHLDVYKRQLPEFYDKVRVRFAGYEGVSSAVLESLFEGQR